MQEIAIRMGGQAGDGIASIGETVSRSFSRMGLHVFGMNSYQSVIRGGHVWFHTRSSPERVYSQGDGYDVLYALDKQTADIHLSGLHQGGTLIYDPEKFTLPPESIPVGTHVLAVPTLEIARKFTTQSILQNAAGLGAIAYLAGIPLDVLQKALSDSFGKKKGDVVVWNLGAAEEGYKFAQSKGPANPHALKPMGPPKLLMNGNQAIALGAAAGGCKFLAQYPMTPATSIMHWMAAHAQQVGVVVKQAEDELAAVNMAIGASFAGVRSMTASSGGGFSLMVEALGMAGMTETPVVVVDSQRAGPSTGLPTKTEQGDLNLMLGAGQSEFPRAILAPSHPVEGYRTMIEAFQLAERWQTAVLVAIDLHYSESYLTVDREEISFDVPLPSLYTVEPNGHDYKRYRYTPDGVSPRAIPGQPGLNFVAGSDEHDEKGHLISDIRAGLPIWVDERTKMMEKRMSKLEGLRHEAAAPIVEGASDPALTFVAWGSTVGAVRDAMRELAIRGVPTRLIYVRSVYPVQADALRSALARSKKVLLVEANYSGQLGHLLRADAGIDLPNRFLKFNGEPFSPMEIVHKSLELLGRA